MGAFLAVLTAAGCDCDSGLTMVGQDTGVKPRCTGDADCAEREACNVSIGVCYPLDECDDARPCAADNQLCEDRDGDGFNECVFQRCTDDDECTAIQCEGGLVPACIAGGCDCGEPCNGGCPSGQGCCVPTEICHELPPQCLGLDCPPGQFVSVTSTGAWDTGQCMFLGESCQCERLPPLPLGDIGLYSALAHDGQGNVMSAYNLDYGDLMFGLVGIDGTVSWEFVDGVPTSTGSITGDIDGPRAGNSAPGEDVGIYTDLAIDSLGRPHITYQDRDRGALKYARRGNSGWQIHTIEGAGVGDTGLYSSLVLDASDRPIVAYLSAREPSGASRRSVLRLAVAETATPSVAADWTLRDLDVLDLGALDCEDRCNVEEVCLASNESCVVPDSPPLCNPGCGSGTRCIGNSCEAIEDLPAFRDLPLARGLWPSIQRMPDGGVLIAYYDRVEGNLELARVSGPNPATGGVSLRTIDGNGAPNGSTDDAGLFPSLYVTPGGEIHVAYMNADRQAIWYRNLDTSLGSLITEEIEGGLNMGGGPDGVLIGADSALVVDASGTVRVAYQDATHGDLRYARRQGGTWTVFTLAGDEMPYEGSFGFYADQALAPDRTTPTVSTYRYFLSAPNGPNNGVELFAPP